MRVPTHEPCRDRGSKRRYASCNRTLRVYFRRCFRSPATHARSRMLAHRSASSRPARRISSRHAAMLISSPIHGEQAGRAGSRVFSANRSAKTSSMSSSGSPPSPGAIAMWACSAYAISPRPKWPPRSSGPRRSRRYSRSPLPMTFTGRLAQRSFQLQFHF